MTLPSLESDWRSEAIGPRYIATEMFESSAIVGLDTHLGMQGEAVLIGARADGAGVEAVGVGGLFTSALDTFAGFGGSRRAEGDASSNGCGGQEGEEGVGLDLSVYMLFAWRGPEATIAQEAHDVGLDRLERGGDVLLVDRSRRWSFGRCRGS